MRKFEIIDTPEGCNLVASSLSTTTHLPLPITKADAKALILAAFKSDDEHPRAEFHGILADRNADGVRVRKVANNSWFDIPWAVIARELA
ncbi:MAG: hypothetical protein H6901_02835 [Rhodobacteraceae bacterium]|nr:hypothetical protein [Paracoccaceae bacterium]